MAIEIPALVIINLFLLPATVAILVVGIILNLRHTQNNVYRKYLVTMLSFWSVILSYVYVDFFIDGTYLCSFNAESASMRVILLGIPCFFTIVSYPIAILNANLIKVKYWVAVLSPMLIALAVYFAWHAISGFDPFYNYVSLADLIDNIASAHAILRMLVVILFILYIIAFTVNIWKAVPVYNKYIHDNIANSDCNVDWVRSLVRRIIFVSICYFLMAFSTSRLLNALYFVSIMTLFTFIVEMSLFKRTSEDIEALKLKWTRKRGWYVIEKTPEITDHILQNDFGSIKERLDKWMNDQKPYLNIEFTIDDILDEFTDLTHGDVTAFFKLNDETFQMYVRRFRIEHACDLIEKDNGEIALKHIFNKIGFSHYSSFSRAFVAHTGQSPSEYLTNYKDNKIQQD